jgi:KDO2-lipid IV(A) lauroyltransferase
MKITLNAILSHGKMQAMPLRLLAPRYWSIWFGLALLRGFATLPFSWLLVIGGALGHMLRLMLTRFSRTARRNMELCLPLLTAEEREYLLDRHFESLGIALFETSLCWWASHERIRALAKVEGREHLDAALAQGKGVILLSAHFTTLEMSARILATFTPINIMYRPAKNECLAYFLGCNRERLAKRAIPRDDMRTLITALKNNECVWYAPNQTYRKNGAQMARLFGIPAATDIATSQLAQMTGATVLPYYAERLPGNRGYRAVIHPPMAGFPSGNPVVDAEAFNRTIENQVRVVPEQYLWIHKRFRGLAEDYPDYYGASVPATGRVDA